MIRAILNLSLASCAFSIVGATCAFGDLATKDDANTSFSLEKNTENLEDFNTINACLKAIKNLPLDERPSFGQKEWLKDEQGTYIYEDKIYDPEFWKSSVNKKLEKISCLNDEEKIKIIKLFLEEDQIYAINHYKNKLFDLNNKNINLLEKTDIANNFYNFLVENTKKKSIFSKFFSLFFKSTKKLDDPNLEKACATGETKKNGMEDIVFVGDKNVEDLRDVLSLVSMQKEKYDMLEREYNQLISDTLEIFIENFPSIKEILVNFYGEDFKNKFDCDEIDFNDKNIPKEVKILANAQKILRIDLDKFLCG